MKNAEINKMNKESLAQYLITNGKSVKDESLVSRIRYTLNAYQTDTKKVSISDLRTIVKEVNTYLTENTEGQTQLTLVETAPENSVKKVSDTETSETPAEANAPVVDEKTTGVTEKTAPKKSVKKKASKKSETSKNEVSTPPVVTVNSTKKVDLITAFADGFNLGDLHFKRADELVDIKSVSSAIESGDEIYVAFAWTKRMLAQYDYAQGLTGIEKPKSFPSDIDLVSIIHADKVVLGVSVYTSMPYILQGSEFALDDEGLRYSFNMEFCVYRAVKTPAVNK